MTGLKPIVMVAAALGLAAPARADTNWAMRVRAVGDWLLAQQTSHGCIPDVPDGLRANQDSAMEHALLALANAYRATTADRFRRGLRDGIEWLAATMEKQERGWIGSWRYAYAAKPPYVGLPTSPCDGVEDARGLTATSALFPYLVLTYADLTGDNALLLKVRPHCRAALDFLLDRNLGENDLFYHGWERVRGTAKWELHRRQYAADQAAAYLGLRAGERLLGQRRYRVAADRLARRVDDHLFDKQRKAFGRFLDEQGKLAPPVEEPESYFIQGYLAWAFGFRRETEDAIQWLKARQAPDDTFRRRKTDPIHILPSAAFCLGAGRLNLYPADRRKVKRWLRDYALTPEGAVREVFAANSPTPSHLAGWLTAAVLEVSPLPSDAPDVPRQTYRSNQP